MTSKTKAAFEKFYSKFDLAYYFNPKEVEILTQSYNCVPISSIANEMGIDVSRAQTIYKKGIRKMKNLIVEDWVRIDAGAIDSDLPKIREIQEYREELAKKFDGSGL